MGGHDEEIGRDVHVHLPHHVKVVQVLGRHFRNGNVVDVDLVLPDQIQKKIERSLVKREGNL